MHDPRNHATVTIKLSSVHLCLGKRPYLTSQLHDSNRLGSQTPNVDSIPKNQTSQEEHSSRLCPRTSRSVTAADGALSADSSCIAVLTRLLEQTNKTTLSRRTTPELAHTSAGRADLARRNAVVEAFMVRQSHVSWIVPG